LNDDAEQDLGWGSILKSNAIPEYDLPSGVEGTLRNYQKEGYDWIRFLFENKVSYFSESLKYSI